jgi:transcriptional/translational regulatory protein YebC/TACO1
VTILIDLQTQKQRTQRYGRRESLDQLRTLALEVAIEAGADDVVSNPDGSVDVLTEPASFQTVKAAMAVAGLEPEQAEVTQRAGSNITLGLEDAQKMIKLLDLLEDLDDTQNVYSNADIPDDILAKL